LYFVTKKMCLQTSGGGEAAEFTADLVADLSKKTESVTQVCGQGFAR
jgi:hypothetical protein